MFIPCAYGGRASDKFILNDSGFLNCISSGDQIMVDIVGAFLEELKGISQRALTVKNSLVHI